ncbi:unnamed protein product [Chrysoparadoxa australica]
MGVTQLLPTLKHITTEGVGIEEFSGLTAGVDVALWMWKGAYSCNNEGELIDKKYLNYPLEMIELLRSKNITPYLVFDGRPLPIKAETYVDRGEKTLNMRQMGADALQAGENQAAGRYFRLATGVSPAMNYQLVLKLRERGVRFVVAPYEADAQLAYMSQIGLVDFVISDDSDCIPYGCKKTLFKLRRENLRGDLICRSEIINLQQPIDLANWKNRPFIHMCLLAGCDYIPSIKGIGIKTAYELVQKHSDRAKLLMAVRDKAKAELPEDFEQRFVKGYLTFRHQTVYDIATKCCVPLTPYKEEAKKMGDLRFLGKRIPHKKARDLAEGKINPHTMEYWSGENSNDREPAPPAPPAMLESSRSGVARGHGSQSRAEEVVSSIGPVKDGSGAAYRGGSQQYEDFPVPGHRATEVEDGMVITPRWGSRGNDSSQGLDRKDERNQMLSHPREEVPGCGVQVVAQRVCGEQRQSQEEACTPSPSTMWGFQRSIPTGPAVLGTGMEATEGGFLVQKQHGLQTTAQAQSSSNLVVGSRTGVPAACIGFHSKHVGENFETLNRRKRQKQEVNAQAEGAHNSLSLPQTVRGSGDGRAGTTAFALPWLKEGIKVDRSQWENQAIGHDPLVQHQPLEQDTESQSPLPLQQRVLQVRSGISGIQPFSDRSQAQANKSPFRRHQAPSSGPWSGVAPQKGIAQFKGRTPCRSPCTSKGAMKRGHALPLAPPLFPRLADMENLGGLPAAEDNTDVADWRAQPAEKCTIWDLRLQC